MFESVIEAAKNFCIHQLDATPELKNKKLDINDGAIVAYIDTQDKNDKYRIYLIGTKKFVQMVAKVFLEEETSDTETLLDMAMECTNMIVGNAKVLAQDKDLNFNISTPHIEKIENFCEDVDYTKTIVCNNNELFICMKKIS